MSTTRTTWLASALCAAALAACGGGTASAPGPTTATNASVTTGDQASAGAKLFGDKCASCHGANGEGSKDAPAVVGKSALPLAPSPQAKYRKGQFATVADVFQFVKTNMPPDAPGSLRDDEYWAILAFDLKANGVDLGGKRLDAALAPTLVLHR